MTSNIISIDCTRLTSTRPSTHLECLSDIDDKMFAFPSYEIVVSYARPFSGNRGENTRNHQLGKKFVPTEFRALHEELLRLRREQFAHTDRTYYKPQAADFSKPGRKWFPMSFRGYDYSKLDAQVPSIEKLVAAVERNLQLEIDTIESCF